MCPFVTFSTYVFKYSSVIDVTNEKSLIFLGESQYNLFINIFDKFLRRKMNVHMCWELNLYTLDQIQTEIVLQHHYHIVPLCRIFLRSEGNMGNVKVSEI